MKLNIFNKIKSPPLPIEENIEMVDMEPPESNPKPAKCIERSSVFRYRLWDKKDNYIYRFVIERLFVGSSKRERDVYTYTTENIRNNTIPQEIKNYKFK